MNDNGETPRRLTLRDAYQDAQNVIEHLTTRTAAGATVSVECDDTAKGDTTPTVKLYAPLEDCDYEALAAHAARVAEIAVETHRRVRDAFPRVS